MTSNLKARGHYLFIDCLKEFFPLSSNAWFLLYLYCCWHSVQARQVSERWHSAWRWLSNSTPALSESRTCSQPDSYNPTERIPCILGTYAPLIHSSFLTRSADPAEPRLSLVLACLLSWCPCAHARLYHLQRPWVETHGLSSPLPAKKFMINCHSENRENSFQGLYMKIEVHF